MSHSFSTTFCLVFLFCFSFAINHKTEDRETFEAIEENIEPVQFYGQNTDIVGADDVLAEHKPDKPQKSALIQADTSKGRFEVKLPEVYRIGIVFDDKNDKNETEQFVNETYLSEGVSEALEEMDTIVKEIVDIKPNNSSENRSSDEPKFILNNQEQTPSVVSTGQSPKVEISADSELNSTITPLVFITSNETKLEKSFLSEIEEVLGLSTNGSPKMGMSIAALTMLISLSLVYNKIIGN